LDSQFGQQLWLINRALFPCMVASTTFSVLACAGVECGEGGENARFAIYGQYAARVTMCA
jgi:hypothetical protein